MSLLCNGNTDISVSRCRPMPEAERSSPGVSAIGDSARTLGRVAAAVGEGARSALHSGRCRPPAFLLNFDNGWDDDPAPARANSAAAELI
jgi:hypothetical protein